MNLYQLKVFYYSAKYSSLSRAAEELYITQPAVTKQIQQLQNYYGIKLLNRFGKKMVLTDSGEALYKIAEKILDLENQAEEIIRDFKQLKSGHIKILSSESFGAYYLPFVLDRFHKAYPYIRISVNVLPVEEIYENTSRLTCDIGFVSYTMDNPKIEAREILKDSIVLIVPPSHPYAEKSSFSPQELENQPIIMHEEGSATRRIVDNFLKKYEINVKIIFEFSNIEAIKRAVENRMGISLVSKNTIFQELKGRKLVSLPFEDRTLTRSFFLIYHKDKYFSTHLQRLIEITSEWASGFNSS